MAWVNFFKRATGLFNGAAAARQADDKVIQALESGRVMVVGSCVEDPDNYRILPPGQYEDTTAEMARMMKRMR